MNKRAKQRLIGVTMLIFVTVGALIWFTQLGNATATPVAIDAVLSDRSLVGKQVEVTGQVVAGSWVSGAKPFVFEIEDEESEGRVRVTWNDIIPGSFGDGTTATVTGTIAEDGSVDAKYLVTKCPSKYESATGALTVNDLTARAGELSGITVKVTGFVVAGSIAAPGSPVRFSLADNSKAAEGLEVAFDGGLSEEFTDGVKAVITGFIEEDGTFQCSEVALDRSTR